MMYEIRTTDAFENWLKALKDRKAVLVIAKRLDRAVKGNLLIVLSEIHLTLQGFRCAHAALYGGNSCSEAVSKIVRARGPFGGYRDIRARFQACKEANETLIRNGQRRRGRNDCDECPDRDCSDACRSRKMGCLRWSQLRSAGVAL
jgi:hypothetical protein